MILIDSLSLVPDISWRSKNLQLEEIWRKWLGWRRARWNIVSLLFHWERILKMAISNHNSLI